ncbi:unnamed protein product [Paramecium pentaurelia]|uniref:Uncharacterized protein n=1 Tax=Paramecium pentaurelia TaxID=43138 RepID=A0A8S1TMC7_9CILI|nr:unnamed protein product [Paramecium pentaurelia]
MGTCAAQKQKNVSNDGELSETMFKVRMSHDSQAILREKTNQKGSFNPFKNPIVNRRIKEIPVQSNNCSLLE